MSNVEHGFEIPKVVTMHTCRHLRWEHFRTALVQDVLRERIIRKRGNPANMWHRFRVPDPSKQPPTPWR